MLEPIAQASAFQVPCFFRNVSTGERNQLDSKRRDHTNKDVVRQNDYESTSATTALAFTIRIPLHDFLYLPQKIRLLFKSSAGKMSRVNARLNCNEVSTPGFREGFDSRVVCGDVR